jgi:hypothetical protein
MFNATFHVATDLTNGERRVGSADEWAADHDNLRVSGGVYANGDGRK